jgi:hypothetical protein
MIMESALHRTFTTILIVCLVHRTCQTATLGGAAFESSGPSRS